MIVCEFQLSSSSSSSSGHSYILTSPVEFNGICLQHLGVEYDRKIIKADHAVWRQT